MGSAAPAPCRAILDLGAGPGGAAEARAALEAALQGELRALVVLGGLENGAGAALDALAPSRTLEALVLACEGGRRKRHACITGSMWSRAGSNLSAVT